MSDDAKPFGYAVMYRDKLASFYHGSISPVVFHPWHTVVPLYNLAGHFALSRLSQTYADGPTEKVTDFGVRTRHSETMQMALWFEDGRLSSGTRGEENPSSLRDLAFRWGQVCRDRDEEITKLKARPPQNERFHVDRMHAAYKLGAESEDECPYAPLTVERIAYTYGVTARSNNTLLAAVRGQVEAQNNEIVALKKRLRDIEGDKAELKARLRIIAEAVNPMLALHPDKDAQS